MNNQSGLVFSFYKEEHWDEFTGWDLNSTSWSWIGQSAVVIFISTDHISDLIDITLLSSGEDEDLSDLFSMLPDWISLAMAHFVT